MEHVSGFACARSRDRRSREPMQTAARFCPPSLMTATYRMMRVIAAWALVFCLLPAASLAQTAAEAPDAPDAGPAPTPAPTEARLEALQTLASGLHPGVPLDSLL